MSDRELGKQLLVSALSTDPATNRPKLFLSHRCKHTIREWQSLRYREGSRDENSLTAFKGSDHAYDAARYGIVAATWIDPPRRRNWMREHEKHLRWRNRRRIPERNLVGSPVAMGG
jgi:hypothetical protein